MQYISYPSNWKQVNIKGINIIADEDFCTSHYHTLDSGITTIKNYIFQLSPFRDFNIPTLIVYPHALAKAQSNIGINEPDFFYQQHTRILYTGLDSGQLFNNLYTYLIAQTWDNFFRKQTHRNIKDMQALKNAYTDYLLYQWTELDSKRWATQPDLYIQYKALVYFIYTTAPKNLKYFLYNLSRHTLEESLEILYNKDYKDIKQSLNAFIHQNIEGYAVQYTGNTHNTISKERYHYHRFQLQKSNEKPRHITKIDEPIYQTDAYHSVYPMLLAEDSLQAHYIHPYKGVLHLYSLSKSNHKAKRHSLKCQDIQVLSFSDDELHFISTDAHQRNKQNILNLHTGRLQSALLLPNDQPTSGYNNKLLSDKQQALLHFTNNAPYHVTPPLRLLKVPEPITPPPAEPKAVAIQDLQLHAYKSTLSVDVLSNAFLQNYQPYGLQSGHFNSPRLNALTAYSIYDIFEDYQFDIAYRLPLNLSGSEYFLSFINRKQQTDWGMSIIRSVRPMDNTNSLPWLDEQQRPIPSYAKMKAYQLNFFVAYPLSFKHTVTNQLSLNRHTIYFPSINAYAHRFDAITQYHLINNTTFNYKRSNDRALRLNKSYFEHNCSIDLITQLPRLAYVTLGIEDRIQYKTFLSNLFTIAIDNQIGYSFGSKKMLYRFNETENNFIRHTSDTAQWEQELPYAYQKIKYNLRGFENNIHAGHAYNLINVDLMTVEISKLLAINTGIHLVNNIKLGILYDNLIYYNKYNNLEMVHAVGGSIETLISNKRVGLNVSMPIQSNPYPRLNLYIN